MTIAFPPKEEIGSFLDRQSGNIEAVAAAAEAVLGAYESKYTERGAFSLEGKKKLTEAEATDKQKVRDQVLKDDTHNPNAVPRDTHAELRLLNNTLYSYANGTPLNSQDQLTLHGAGATLAYAKGLLERAQDFTDVPGLFSNVDVQKKIAAGLAAFEGEQGLTADAAKLNGATPDNPFHGLADASLPVLAKGQGAFLRREQAKNAARMDGGGSLPSH